MYRRRLKRRRLGYSHHKLELVQRSDWKTLILKTVRKVFSFEYTCVCTEKWMFKFHK